MTEKSFFQTDDRAVDVYIPTELYQRADLLFRLQVTEALKKEFGDNKIELTTFHWFKRKSKTTTKVITFQKNHFILPTDFWTGNVSVNSGTKDKKAIFNSTNSILSKVDKVAAPNNIKVILDGSIEKIKNIPFNI